MTTEINYIKYDFKEYKTIFFYKLFKKLKKKSNIESKKF